MFLPGWLESDACNNCGTMLGGSDDSLPAAIASAGAGVGLDNALGDGLGSSVTSGLGDVLGVFGRKLGEEDEEELAGLDVRLAPKTCARDEKSAGSSQQLNAEMPSQQPGMRATTSFRTC